MVIEDKIKEIGTMYRQSAVYIQIEKEKLLAEYQETNRKLIKKLVCFGIGATLAATIGLGAYNTYFGNSKYNPQASQKASQPQKPISQSYSQSQTYSSQSSKNPAKNSIDDAVNGSDYVMKK